MQKLKDLHILWAGIMVISFLTLVSAGIPYAQGATWYVKTDGSDTNGGTSWGGFVSNYPAWDKRSLQG